MFKSNEMKLKEELKNLLVKLSQNNKIKKDLAKEFLERNMSTYRAMNVFMGNESLDTMTDREEDVKFLFIFTLALNKSLENNSFQNEIIDIKNYFTDVEYKKWIDYKEENEDEEDVFPIVFENVEEIVPGKVWQTSESAQGLDKMDRNNILLYNFKTQRNPKFTASGGMKIDFDKNKVYEIKNRMLEGEQFPDHIKINVLKNFQEKIKYNPNKKQLIIDKPSVINIFDGYHRKVGNSLALEENSELEFKWPLIITNLTENEAQDYMVQIDKQKPIKKEQIQTWDSTKIENLVVQVIEDDRISKLAKVMKSQDAELKHSKNGLTTRHIISTAIAENYELDETTDIRDLANWIVKFTDYLIGLYPDEFIKNPQKYKDNSVINHKNMFYGFIALSAILWHNDRWEKYLESIIKKIDFSKDNEIWGDINLLKTNMNKSSRKKLYKIFKDAGGANNEQQYGA